MMLLKFLGTLAALVIAGVVVIAIGEVVNMVRGSKAASQLGSLENGSAKQ